MDNQNIIISGVHVELTDALKSIVNTKARTIFNHDGDNRIMRLRVNLEVSKNKSTPDDYIAHGRLEVDGPDIEASANSSDLYKSIDEMVAKLDRQFVEKLKKQKDARRN